MIYLPDWEDLSNFLDLSNQYVDDLLEDLRIEVPDRVMEFRSRTSRYRMLLLLQYIPIEVLRSDNSHNNHLIIEEHLLNKFNVDQQIAKKLRWQFKSLVDELKKRRDKSTESEILLRRQDSKCAHCNHHFYNIEVLKQDFFMPFFWYEEELNYEIDHVIPISQFGNNNLENLQALCKFCNRGKADGNPPHLSTIFQWCSYNNFNKKPPSKMLGFLRWLSYYRIDYDNRRCTRIGCQTPNSPLTLEIDDPSLPLTLNNVRTVCQSCKFEME